MVDREEMMAKLEKGANLEWGLESWLRLHREEARWVWERVLMLENEVLMQRSVEKAQEERRAAELRAVRSLLAVIHRDRGYCVRTHGLEIAAVRAKKEVKRWVKAIETLEEDIERLQRGLDEVH